MALELDMTKSARQLTLSLQKKGILRPPVCEVAFDLDVSGSYEDEHRDGITNMLLARLVPWGLVFDPDKQLDVFTFSSRQGAAHHLTMVNEGNYSDFVQKYVIDNVPGWCGGTEYAPVLRANLETFGWIGGSAAAPAKKGFFGLGRQQPEAPAAQPAGPRKSLVLFNTDGETQDPKETDALFQEMQDRGYGMYVQFIGVSNQGPGTFGLIEQLADKYDNCGLTEILDVRSWVQLSDEEINEQLISDELIAWFNK